MISLLVRDHLSVSTLDLVPSVGQGDNGASPVDQSHLISMPKVREPGCSRSTSRNSLMTSKGPPTWPMPAAVMPLDGSLNFARALRDRRQIGLSVRDRSKLKAGFGLLLALRSHSRS